MSNKSVLENLLSEISEYEIARLDRDSFAERFQRTIEALDAIPYSVITESRDWQYKIETEGYFDEEGFESESEDVITNLKLWVTALIASHS